MNNQYSPPITDWRAVFIDDWKTEPTAGAIDSVISGMLIGGGLLSFQLLGRRRQPTCLSS